MKTIILFLLTALMAQASTLEEVSQFLASERQARKVYVWPVPVLNEPVSATLPTNIHSSIAPADLARVPAILKLYGAATAMLKWTAPIGTEDNPVIGYHIKADSAWNTPILYSTTTEFPFNCEYINVVNGEFWRVRAVFKDGSVSAWNVSLTFPDRLGW